MSKVFDFILNFYSAVFFATTILSFIYYLFRGEDMTKAFLHAYLFWNIGVRGIIAFIANTYPPTARTIAQAYNWQEGTLIQRELAANTGAIGILGVLCLWFGGLFWLAALIAGTLTCIISEIGNLTSIFKDKKHPFATGPNKSSYIISAALFAGMHLDLAVSCFALILGLFTLIPTSS